VLAILMAALAPTVSHALIKADPVLTQVCSVLGLKWVKTDGPPADPSPVPQGGHFTDHCPYCSLHASALLVAAVEWSATVTLAGQRLPVAFLAAPRTLHAWASAQPRAPPFLS